MMTSRHLFRRLVAVAAATAAFVGLAAAPASAYTADDVYYFRSDNDCLWGQAEIDSAGTQGVQSDVLTLSLVEAPVVQLNCSWLYDRPIGWLATNIQNWYWDGYSWLLCRESGWLYNQSVSSSNSYSWSLGLACGTGWYGTYGFGYAWRDDKWQGGNVWSGAEHIIFNTLNAGTAAATPPAAPEWIRPDGTTDATKLPATIQVAGRDGKPTGATVSAKELLTAPPVPAPGTIASNDPAGVNRSRDAITGKNGKTAHTERATLTSAFHGQI
jgi:hypothetical protein